MTFRPATFRMEIQSASEIPLPSFNFIHSDIRLLLQRTARTRTTI
jgi:hypothetical protein